MRPFPLCFSSACFNLVIKCCRERALSRESGAAAHKRQIRTVCRDTNVTLELILLICLKRLRRADRQAAVNGVLRPGEEGPPFPAAVYGSLNMVYYLLRV